MTSIMKRRQTAFTLVELLVVIGVIAVLVALLMPALARARKAANTVVCLSNVRQIDLMMVMYAQENKGAILGNAWTSAAFLKGGTSYSDSNCPTVCQTWDWTAPIAKMMKAKFDEGPSIASRTSRFDFLCRYAPFQCPENDIVMAPYSGSSIKVTTRMISYDTALMFQYVYGSGDVALYQNFINTGNFHPKITEVGNSSQKIFISDGARWTSTDTAPPDYNLGWDNSGSSPGGQYADYGPWSGFTRSFLRSIPIVYAMRHGIRKVNAELGAYRFNVGFFDGHAETVDGRTGMNPQLWIPKGSTLPSSELSSEANLLYMSPKTSLHIN